MAQRMTVRGMRERAEYGPMLATAGQPRQVFADLEPRRVGGDRLELASDSVGCVGLEVETIVLRQPAREKNIDARLGLAGGFGPGGRRGTQLVQVVRTQAQQTDRAGLDRGSAGDEWMA